MHVSRLRCVWPVLVLGAFVAPAAEATDFFCNNYLAGDHPQHYQCVQTTVGPGAPLVLSSDQAGGGPLFASSTSAGSGPFASSSTANAFASPGLLRGFASAEVFSGSVAEAQAVARSDAWFSSGGTVVGGVGVAAGTPVRLRFAIDVGGGFAGGSIFHSASEALVDLVVGAPNGRSLFSRAQIDKFNPHRVITTDVDAFVGDTFEMIMKMHVSAGAGNGGQPGDTASIADVSNTGHLFVDVLSGDAAFVGSDGHLYATTTVAAVPEPSGYALMLAGLAFVGALARRRRGGAS